MTPKAMSILTWIVSGLAAAILAITGAAKFLAYDMEVELFHGWGYPAWFVIVVGLGELTAAATILWPRASFYGAVLGALLMAGAIVTHLRVPEVGLIPLAALLLLLCIFVAWRRRAARWPLPGEGRTT